MPAQLDTQVAAPVVSTAPLIEIESCICGVVSPRLSRAGGLGQLLEERDPELMRRLRSFWDDGHDEFVEFFVVLERHGLTLEQDVDAVLDRLPRLLEQRFEVPPLPSEEPGVRDIVQARLDHLATSPEARNEYVALLRGIWQIGREAWTDYGRALAEAAAAEIRQRLDRGERPLDVLPRKHLALNDAYAEMMNGSQPIVITPFGLNIAVKYILQVEGGPVYVGFGPESDAKDETHRQRAEEGAAAFKVLSDPTRLSMLGYLLHMGASVSDLARIFDVSQPTVSAHVKILREAGLLTQAKSGSHTLYRADSRAVQALIDRGASAIWHIR